MAARKLEMRNYGGKSPVSIKYQNLYSFKEEVILLYQSILETRRITHLHDSALFTIPLSYFDVLWVLVFRGLFRTQTNIYDEAFCENS